MFVTQPKAFAALALFGALFSAPASFAGILELEPETRTIEGVKLSDSAVLTAGEKKIKLKRFAAGLRKKKVAIFWANVYVGQVFSTEGLASPPKSIEEGLETLAKQPVVAITLSFLRDVSVDKMKAAFEDSLQTNKIDPKAEAMKPLFSVVEKSGGMKDKLTTTIVLERAPDGKESFRFENGKGEVQASGVESGAIRKILTMWFGKPADSGVERLHKQFLGKED